MMSCKSKALELVLIIVVLILSTSVVYAYPDSHEIMQKLSQEEMSPMVGTIQMKFPKGWTSHADASGLRFVVPYHPGVMGGIRKTERVYETSELLDELKGIYGTDMVMAEEKTYENGKVTGKLSRYSGRIGGEKWDVFVFNGQITGGHSVLFYAATPIAWYRTYEALFEQILNSLE